MRTKRTILLAAFIAFIGFQFFFITKRVHNYPFMIYDMYSRPEAKHRIGHQYRIVAGKDTVSLSDLPLLLEGRIINSIRLYEYHLDHHEDPWAPALESRTRRFGSGKLDRRAMKLLSNSPQKVSEYPEWLKELLEKKILRKAVPEMSVYKLSIDLENREILQSRKLIEI